MVLFLGVGNCVGVVGQLRFVGRLNIIILGRSFIEGLCGGLVGK